MLRIKPCCPSAPKTGDLCVVCWCLHCALCQVRHPGQSLWPCPQPQVITNLHSTCWLALFYFWLAPYLLKSEPSPMLFTYSHVADLREQALGLLYIECCHIAVVCCRSVARLIASV